MTDSKYQQYKGSIANVVKAKIEAGAGHLRGASVLLAPITAEMQTGGIILAVENGRGDHEIHEVIAVADDVSGIEVGQHVIHLDAGAKLIPNGASADFALVHEKYILAAWNP
ncbi:MAG: hypothetical protein VW405_01575 [Rhodospirillaceae bacterium]